VALHTACRLALIAFATVALRGVLDGSEFRTVLILAIKIGTAFFGIGLIIGELARRLLEDLVNSKIRKVIDENVRLDNQQQQLSAES
jgi:predicted translin family RNA/ssDNA-binding protein